MLDVLHDSVCLDSIQESVAQFWCFAERNLEGLDRRLALSASVEPT